MAITNTDSPLTGRDIPIRRLSIRDQVTIHTTSEIVHGIVADVRANASSGHESLTAKLTTQDYPNGHLKLSHRLSENVHNPTRLTLIQETQKGGQRQRSLGTVDRIVLDGHVPLQGGDHA